MGEKLQMNFSNFFAFNPVSVVGSFAVTFTGFELQQINEITGNIVLILNGVFLIIGILKNLPLDKLKDTNNKKQKK